MSTKSRRPNSHSVALDDYRIVLREMLEAITPVAEWDPRAGLTGIDTLSDDEQRVALDRWFRDVEQRVSCLQQCIDRMSQIHPPDGSLLKLHQAAIALGADHARCVGMRIDALKHAGSDETKARMCMQRSTISGSHLSGDNEQLARRIDHLRRHNPDLLARLDLPMVLQ